MGNMRVGDRLRALRDSRDMTQADVAQMLSLKDRQSVSAIEAGERDLKPSELVALVRGFRIPIDYFTDPFLIPEEAEFSWRRREEVDVETFEQRSKGWIGMYLGLAKEVDLLPATLPRIDIVERSSFEEALAAGEKIAKEYWGDRPAAHQLTTVIEEKLGTLLLMVDAEEGISGAACHLKGLNVILVNRNEWAGRRSFDIAHELFHVLTWAELPPEYLDGTSPLKAKQRAEQLADQFAAGLLMPKFLLEQYGRPEGELAAWLNRIATEFGVSANSLKWRIKNLGWITDNELKAIDDDDLRYNGRPSAQGDTPLLFSAQMLKVVSASFAAGAISVRRAAEILELTVDDLGTLMDAHGIERNFDL